MAKKKAKDTGKIINRRARYDYELGDSLIAGLQLTGKETKALRLGHGQLRGAYVTLKDNEAWLIGAQIMSTNNIQLNEQEQSRSRKLLLKAKELEELAAARQSGRTIVPIELLTKGRFIKLRIAIGKGKKRYDKREDIKRREQQRDIARKINA
jgi:SsrA-binding protein